MFPTCAEAQGRILQRCCDSSLRISLSLHMRGELSFRPQRARQSLSIPFHLPFHLALPHCSGRLSRPTRHPISVSVTLVQQGLFPARVARPGPAEPGQAGPSRLPRLGSDTAPRRPVSALPNSSQSRRDWRGARRGLKAHVMCSVCVVSSVCIVLVK